MDQQQTAQVEVDARGLSCPIPVIRVKDAITQNPGAAIRVLIEDQETEENVTRLAQGLGLTVSKPAPAGPASERRSRSWAQRSKRCCFSPAVNWRQFREKALQFQTS